MKKVHVMGAVIAIIILLGILFLFQGLQTSGGSAADNDVNAVHLTWTNDDPGVSQFAIYRSDVCLSTPNQSKLVATVKAPQTRYNDSNVVKGTLYVYTVFAQTSDGSYSDPSCTSLSL